uniref:ORF60 n=1 Tax=Pinus thunbergii TaxID=3350 RepID=Q32945_PINTH|nr:ORF60 [Pinus thunbergii]BAA04349.1 ORF60 [Pinus thunbergii]
MNSQSVRLDHLALSFYQQLSVQRLDRKKTLHRHSQSFVNFTFRCKKEYEYPVCPFISRSY